MPKLFLIFTVLITLLLGVSEDPHHSSADLHCDRLKESLQELLDHAVKDGLPGVSLVVKKNGCQAIEISSGFADLKAEKPMTPLTNIRLASCSKPFVGVIIMQLVAEGQLSLNDPIAKYLPRRLINNLRNSSKVTVRQLMNHTSGLADYFGNRFTRFAAQSPQKLYQPLDALKFAFGRPPAFSPPGSDYFYSNTNSVLLGMIVEKVLARPLAEVIKERIFESIKLEHSFCETDEHIPDLARGYEIDRGGERIDYTEINQGFGLPDGIVVSNAKDIENFLRSLLTTEILLKVETLKEMLTIDEAARKGREGLNLFIYSRYEGKGYGVMIGHDGEYVGYKSEMFYFSHTQTSFALTTNCSGSGINAKWGDLFEKIVNKINE